MTPPAPRRGVRCAFPQVARAFWVAVRVLYPLFRNRPKKRDPADNMVPAGSHIFPACIKPPAWPLTCENATSGHQIGLRGPLSCRGCTRSRRPKNGPKIGTRAAQRAIYGRGRGPISPGRPAAVERLRLCARRGIVAAWSVLRSPGRRPGRRAAAWSAQDDGRAG